MRAPGEGETPAESKSPDELDFETAYGSGVRKAPAAVAVLNEEAEAAEGGH